MFGKLRRRVIRAFAGKRKRNEAVALLLAVVLMAAVVAAAPASVTAASVQRKLPVYCVRRDQKTVALTFDAAWGNEDTQSLIDILGRYKVKATFFVLGQWADKYPESVKALSDAGHEVMSHSDTHPHMNSLSASQISGEIKTSCDKIEAVTGKRPTLFRAPYGEYNNTVIETTESLGMTAIQWDVDSLDWKDLSAAEIRRRVCDKVAPGSIVLFHNAAKHTPEALPDIIENLLMNGYTIVPVSELLLKGEYTIDHEGRQCPKS